MRRVDLVAPEIFETRWRQLGITHGVLDILVSEIVLDRSLINLKCPNFITECANSDSTDGSVRATRSPRYRAPRLLARKMHRLGSILYKVLIFLRIQFAS